MTRRWCFEREEDGRRVLEVLPKRFGQYGLRLHPEKTRLVDVRSPSRTGPGGPQRERSLVLLGFAPFWGRSRKGRWVVQRKTAKDRFTRALRDVGHWCRAHRHWPVAAQQAALRRKLQGHYAYDGLTGKARALARFVHEVRRLWRKWLHRRSWRGRMTWVRFVRLTERYPLPPPRVVHRVYRRAATPSSEEPDARIGHVRICGSRGRATARGHPARSQSRCRGGRSA
jgi:RNA-directed DNA polymerase